jgi:ectoine hydroxylase-related dioxygenase (phytanoyl-CoA dioxygenase family)
VKDFQQQYVQDGFTALPPVLPAQTIDELVAALSDWSAHAPPATREYGILQFNLWQHIPRFRDLILEGDLGALAASILGVESVTLFQDNLIWKPPGTTGQVQWHQDYAYWPLSAPRGLTMWLALDEITADMGCIRYVPGSHELGEKQPTNFISPGSPSWRQDLPPLDWAAHAHRAVVAPLSRGHILVHHPLSWHMSPGNQTDRHRRAWSLTFITDEVRWDPDHAPHPFNHFLAPTPHTPLRGDLFPRLAARRVEFLPGDT